MNTSIHTPAAPAATRSSPSNAAGIAWFSIGAGLTRLLLPGLVRRACGLRSSTRSIRLGGVREVVSGIGILNAPDPAPWVWGRVAGSTIDLAIIGTQGGRAGTLRSLLAFAAVAGIVARDAACASELEAHARQHARLPSDDSQDRRGLTLPWDDVQGEAPDTFEPAQDLATSPPHHPEAGDEAARPADAHLQLVATMPSRPGVPEAVAAPDLIDAEDAGSLQTWGEKLQVTQEQLREAIRSVGARATDVELHLKGTRSTTNADRVDDASLL